MIVDTNWLQQRKFVSSCPSGFKLEMDATEKYGGQGEGLTPMELLLAGVAGCIGKLKTTGIKDACELVIILFDRDFDGKVTKKDLYYHFNSAIPSDTKDVEKEFAKSKFQKITNYT